MAWNTPTMIIIVPAKKKVEPVTAANQLEGAYLEDGKGLSIQDVMPKGIMTPRTDMIGIEVGSDLAEVRRLTSR
mgnify:CR=1 FL=1